MKRVVVCASVTFVAVVTVAAPVNAGPPAKKGCHGESISALASDQPAPGSFGAAVVGFAQAADGRPGLGDGVQALHAGLVPDDVVPNTCND